MLLNNAVKTALIFGATGLVGSELLKLLLSSAQYQKVIAFTRKPIEVYHHKLSNVIVDFDKLESIGSKIIGDDIYICLGTTMKKAGSKEAFYKVDYTYSFEVARIAALNKVNQLLLVSSVGADPDSSIFYSQVKGKLENIVITLPFWSIHIFRPSLLLGQRNEFRAAEAVSAIFARGINALGGNFLGKYKPVEANDVAISMVHAASDLNKGIHLYPSDKIVETAQKISGSNK
jgi:uncharacterized protein YbjT (DUF2867 family)